MWAAFAWVNLISWYHSVNINNYLTARWYYHHLKLSCRQIRSEENDLVEKSAFWIRIIFCELRVSFAMKIKKPNWFSGNQPLSCASYKCNFQMNANKRAPWKLMWYGELVSHGLLRCFGRTEAGVWILIRACREPCSTCQTLNKSQIIVIIIQIDLHTWHEFLKWPSNIV